MFGSDPADLRRQFFDTWRKRTDGLPLSALETLIADVIALHPEYHMLFDDPERYLHETYSPDDGRENPFLHMALHIAVREQLATDRPPGVAAAHRALCARLPDAHAAEHALLECLAEALWQAQRAGQPPDEAAYVAALRARAGID